MFSFHAWKKRGIFVLQIMGKGIYHLKGKGGLFDNKVEVALQGITHSSKWKLVMLNFLYH